MSVDNSKIQTLTDLLRYGSTSSYSIDTISLRYKDKDFDTVFLDKLVYEKYDKLIMSLCSNVELSDEEFMKYKFSPEVLSYDLYNTINLSHLILYVNRCAAYEFKRRNIKLIPPSAITMILQKIIEHEESNLTKNKKSII